MKVSIVTFDDFTDLDLFILWDILNRVHEPNWKVMLIADRPVTVSSTGIEIRMHGTLGEANSSDAVLFCSGKGTRSKMHDRAFLASFELNENRQLIGAIDSGTLLLGALGLLKRKRVTTYPSAQAKKFLESMGAEVVWDSFVRTGNVATAAQCLSGQYLAGWVIETLVGLEQRQKALESIAPLRNVDNVVRAPRLRDDKQLIEIRFATPYDAAAVVSVLENAFTEYRELYTSKGYDATVISEDKVKVRMSEGPMWVAVDIEQIVGTVAAMSQGEALHVRGMGIVPEARGKSIGQLLLKEVEGFAFTHGHKMMTLNTTPFLDRAIALYERFGFERSDEATSDLFGTPLFTMIKILSAEP